MGIISFLQIQDITGQKQQHQAKEGTEKKLSDRVTRRSAQLCQPKLHYG